MSTKRPWTPAEEDRLAELITRMSCVEAALVLGRTKHSCAMLMRRNGLGALDDTGSHTVEIPRPGMRVITHRLGK